MTKETTRDRSGSERPIGDDEIMSDDEARRRQAEVDLDVPIVSALREGAGGPVVPLRLTASNTFCFDCHKGVSCWNECCHDTDITLTPYDLIRIGRAVNMAPGEAARLFGTEAVHEASGMPVMKLKRVDNGEAKRPCVFLDPAEGCSIYADRPAACRYYPLGLASVKMKGHDAPEDFYFLVKETHCKGHEEPREQTVADFRAGQGVEPYDEKNRGWIYILMKLASWKYARRPVRQGAGRAHEKDVPDGDDGPRRVPQVRVRHVVPAALLDRSRDARRARDRRRSPFEAGARPGCARSCSTSRPCLCARRCCTRAIAKARAGLGGT